ncbi:unnamed protein product [Parnassius mnemosyne]|uniref:Uncharacterized protein n=1 Tax=Parnassius mnemosyne TaxID=213953 RepID=A0AAV1KS42_9NEOP
MRGRESVYNNIGHYQEMNDKDAFLGDVHGTSEIIKSTDENTDSNIPSSNCGLGEDPFIAVCQNVSSPYLFSSENQHGVVSLLNISTALTPLNTSILTFVTFPSTDYPSC